MNYLQKRSQLFKTVIAALVLSSVLLTTACIPESAVKKISAFSDGVVAVTDNTEQAYETIETVYRRMKMEKAINRYDPVSTDLNTVKIERYMDEEDWKARKLVLDGLRLYAENLKLVVGNEQVEEFDAQTKAVGQNLASLQEATVRNHILKSEVFTASHITIFTTAINAVGRWFIDYRRKKVVRQTVREMQEHVRNVVNLFADEIGGAPVNAAGRLERTPNPTLRKILWQHYEDYIIAKNDALRRNMGNMSAGEIRAAKQELFDLREERDQGDKTLEAVGKALRAIPDAHNSIELAFVEDDRTLEPKIARIFVEAERIKSYYEDLKGD